MLDPLSYPPDAVFGSSIPFENPRVKAAAISCSDGRFGEQVDEFLQVGLGLPRYDRLAIPGGPACLAGHFQAYSQQDALMQQLGFLVDEHQLRRVILIAHQHCAYYLTFLRVHEIDLLARQCSDLQTAADRVRSLDRRLQVEPYFAVIRGNAVSFRTPDEMMRG